MFEQLTKSDDACYTPRTDAMMTSAECEIALYKMRAAAAASNRDAIGIGNPPFIEASR